MASPHDQMVSDFAHLNTDDVSRDQLIARILRLEAQNAHEVKAKKAWRAKYEKSKKEIEELEDENGVYDNNNRSLQADNNELARKVEILEDDVADKEEEIKRLTGADQGNSGAAMTEQGGENAAWEDNFPFDEGALTVCLHWEKRGTCFDGGVGKGCKLGSHSARADPAAAVQANENENENEMDEEM